jgi:dihydrofolate synthase/folylpolyglutamate synthase
MIAATGAEAFVIGQDFTLSPETNGFSLSLGLKTLTAEPQCFRGLPSSGLLPINKAAALQALSCAGFTLNGDKVISALDGLTLTGRQQPLSIDDRSVILDVAHNPAAAKALAAALKPISGRYLAVASVLNDKDWLGIVEPLSEIFADWRIAEISASERATKAQTLHEVLYNAGLSSRLFESVEEAFQSALKAATKDDVIVVFGSFHTVSAVLNMQRESDGCIQ